MVRLFHTAHTTLSRAALTIITPMYYRWFVVGSVLFTGTSIFILWNSFSEALGQDDSDLDGFHYRATWVLMIISGVFCTLGT
jgi:hypothetical protein